MSKVKIGIIGCGGIANGKHLPSLSKVGDAEMVAFCDLIPERAQKAAKQYGAEGAKVYTDYKELLRDPEIQVVHVLTPNRAHSFITVDALEAGKDVMCEKPMAINYAEARKMLDAAKRTGHLLTIGYQNRYRPDSQFMKKECVKGTFGDIYFAKAKAVRRRGVPTWGVFIDEYQQGGGPLIDIGTHALDLTLWMMNNYRPKYCVGTTYHAHNQDTGTGNGFGDWDPAKFTVEDSAFGFIVMENGATIILESSWALDTLDIGEAKTQICGTNGGADMLDGLRLNGVKNGLLYTLKPETESKGVDFYAGGSRNPGVMEAETWINAVQGKGELTVLPEQAIVVTRILEGIYESAKSGKPYYFE